MADVPSRVKHTSHIFPVLRCLTKIDCLLSGTETQAVGALCNNWPRASYSRTEVISIVIQVNGGRVYLE